MSIERELGELTAQVRSLVRVTESMDTKVDSLRVNQAVLMDQHEKHKKLSHGAVLASLGAIITVAIDYFKFRG